MRTRRKGALVAALVMVCGLLSRRLVGGGVIGRRMLVRLLIRLLIRLLCIGSRAHRVSFPFV